MKKRKEKLRKYFGRLVASIYIEERLKNMLSKSCKKVKYRFQEIDKLSCQSDKRSTEKLTPMEIQFTVELKVFKTVKETGKYPGNLNHLKNDNIF